MLPYTCVIIGYLLVSYSVFFLLDNQNLILLTREDGVFETIGALFFLVTSVLFFILFIKDKSGNQFYFFQTRKNAFFLLLTFVFFIGFGEEISWGQRIFNVQIPEILKEINVQNEINIHNISVFHGLDDDGNRKSFFGLLLNIDRLFSVFWFTYFLIIPILNKVSSKITKLLKTINLPIAAIWIGVFFMTNYLVSIIIALSTIDDLSQPLAEVKECNFAFLFVMVSIWFSKNYSYQTKNLNC